MKFGTGFDVVCKQPVFDSKAFLYNITFDNFRQSYTGGAAACSNNFAMRPHSGGFDFTGSANLFDSKCTNCDTDSYLTAPVNSPSRLGWFGGCGDILCTGFSNYLVQDHTGTFMSSKGTIIPNNSFIGDNENNCVFSSAMNAYTCLNREDFGVLEYQSVAADFNLRIMWPVYLFYEGAGYTTTTNGWSEWEWLGNEPMNRRFGRFVSIVRLNQTYNMTFASEPPHKLQLQIQKRTPAGDNNNNLIVKLHYPRPNTIRLLLNNQVVDPILLTDLNNTASGVQKPLNLSECGSHYYFYTNYSVEFVLTEDLNCLPTIELTESVQLTTHFSINVDQFFNNSNAITNFINNLCALLNIVDTSRVKVVGVHSGSTVVTTSITPSTTNTSDPTPAAAATTASNTAASGALQAGMSNIGFGNVLRVTSVYYPLSTSTEESSSNIGLIVGIAIGCIILVAAVIVTVVCCMRKRAKVVEEIVTHEEENMQEKSVDKDNHFNLNGSSENNNELPNESEFKIKKHHNPNILRVNQLGEDSEIIDN